MDIKRTFEFIEYALKHYPMKDAFNIKRDNKWVSYSTQFMKEKADDFSSALIDLGFKKGDKILTITNNRPEWNIADIGMEQVGVIHVPVFPTLGAKSYEYLINHSEAKMIIVSSEEKYKLIKPIADKIDAVEQVITFDQIKDATAFEDILNKGAETKSQNSGKLQQYRADVTENDVCSIIYTSGTTGSPKGVMLTHKNLVTNALSTLGHVPKDAKKTISFLPINHVFERGFNHMCIRLGIKVFYASSSATLVEEIQEIKPHVFITVPRLLEKIYDAIYSKGMDLKGIKKGIFFSSLRSAEKYEDYKTPGLLQKAKLAFDNKMVFSKWREALGGEIKVIISGGAALQPRLARVFAAAKIPILEGYGLTETSPTITANELGNIRAGTVGSVLPTGEIKIAEDGEVLYKGECLMKGYYKDKERTEQAIDNDGWFHTGDMGELQGNILKITGRKKELFKLSTGNYVSPQLVENIMKESPFIEQIMVLGENERFCGAIICPNFGYLTNWAEQHEITFNTYKDLITNENVLKKLKEEIEELNYDLDPIMTIKKFSLVCNEWAPDTGELTPTLKIKRDFIKEKYKGKFDYMFGYTTDDVFLE